jgi:hypothetical protein
VGAFLKRHPVAAVIFLIAVGLVVYGNINPPPPLTPEQIQEIEARAKEAGRTQAAAAEASRAANERMKTLCRYEAACRKYAESRQQCAAAGNLTLCINVKMGDKDIELVSMCENDGRFRYAPSDMPTRLQCVVHDIGEALP